MVPSLAMERFASVSRTFVLKGTSGHPRVDFDAVLLLK
jgi:hypothetical protein